MKILVTLSILAATAFAAPKSGTVNVNTAPADSIAAHVPGIGPAIAARIISEREAGKFADCADVQARVSGIGAAKIAKACPHLLF